MVDEGYIYFVSFKHEKGYGNVEVNMEDVIVYLEQVNDIEKTLPEWIDNENINVLNYEFFRKNGNEFSNEVERKRHIYLIKYMKGDELYKEEIYVDEKIKSIDVIRAIEGLLSDDINNSVVIVDYKYLRSDSID